MPYFRNEGHYRSEELSRDKFLGVFSHDGNNNLEGLANPHELTIHNEQFYFIILFYY